MYVRIAYQNEEVINLSTCDYCQTGRCTEDRQCEYELFKKGIILLASGMKVLNKHLTKIEIDTELNKKFMGGN